MSGTREDLMDFLIRRSFATKTAILLLGMLLILIGTEIRTESVLVGYSLVGSGLLMDWLIVYLVYVEITQIKEDVDQTKIEIEETWSEIEEAKELAEDAKGWD